VITGTGVHDRPDRVFRINWIGCSRSNGTRNHRRYCDALTETDVEQDGKRFLLRSTPRIAAGLALRAASVTLPPTVQAIAKY
jgi:hypothetical protein